jgi:hypothetical protein
MMVVIFMVVALVFDVGGYLTSTDAERAMHNEARQRQVDTCLEHTNDYSPEAEECTDMYGR